MNPQLLHKGYQSEAHAVKPPTISGSCEIQSKHRGKFARAQGPNVLSVRLRQRPTIAGGTFYSHIKERFSATIRPFAISRHRHAITRPSSKKSSPTTLNSVL